MNGKLTVYKNIAWAASIIICLVALFVGLVVAAFTRYGGEKERDDIVLGETTPAVQLGPITVGRGENDPIDVFEPVPESEDGGQAYIDSLTFLLDSAAIGLRDYGLLSGGLENQQVWGSDAGNIPVADLAELSIRYPVDGSIISVGNAAMIAKPSRLVISVGSDGLSQVTKEEFIAAYEALIRSIRENSPDTQILCCSLSSVVPDYDASDGLSSSLVGEANEWIQTVCQETGCPYLDTGSVVRDSSGSLMSEFASANGKTLNSAGLNKILMYLRTHVA